MYEKNPHSQLKAANETPGRLFGKAKSPVFTRRVLKVKTSLKAGNCVAGAHRHY